MTFNIGDIVYQSEYGRQEHFITCPDCIGSKRVKVILGDGTEISIECGGCDPGGYEPSRGVIRQYRYEAKAMRRTVTGLQINAAGVEYQLDGTSGGWRCGTPETVFATEAEAVAAGEAKKAEAEAEENRRYLAKTKNEKSWAWNASYHTRCAKRAEADLEYHRGKAIVCKAHVKEVAA